MWSIVDIARPLKGWKKWLLRLVFLPCFGFTGGVLYLLFFMVPFEQWFAERGTSRSTVDLVPGALVFGWGLISVCATVFFGWFFLSRRRDLPARIGVLCEPAGSTPEKRTQLLRPGIEIAGPASASPGPSNPATGAPPIFLPAPHPVGEERPREIKPLPCSWRGRDQPTYNEQGRESYGITGEDFSSGGLEGP